MSTSPRHRIDKDDSILMVIDIQDRLLPSIHEHERVVENCVKLIEGAKVIGVPIVWTEQYRKGLGRSNQRIIDAIGDSAESLEKMTFGCLDDEGIQKAVNDLGRKTLVLCGIETHVCVNQTAVAALDAGMKVVLVEDAVSSRTPENRATGIARMTHEGATPASVEMVLLEWLKVSGTETFKKVLPLIK